MARLVIWDKEKAKKELAQRFLDAKNDRRELETRWQENELIVFNTSGAPAQANISIGYEQLYTGEAAELGNAQTNVGINYAFKNFRFIHAQLSANPPSVIPRPTSNDPADRRAADAADRLIRWALRRYKLQEIQDKASLNTLLYGTGFTKSIWDSTKGDPIDMNEETGEYVMEGEYNISVPNVWDIYLDPDADSWDNVNYIFERVLISWEEAKFRFPDKIELLKQFRKKHESDSRNNDNTSGSMIKNVKYDVVELYEYWERGTPMNGFLGRYCLCSKNGDLITDLTENPEKYASQSQDGGTIGKKIPVAVLPYQIFTDIDVPNTVWGKSFVEYAVSLQDNLNRLDNITLDNVRAHGVARLVLPEGSEIADGSITTNPMDVIKITGNQPISFAPPMQLPTALPELMQRYKIGLDDVSGVNEAMFGQQSREQSGFSMQYATNQGNMIRRRLFNKYTLFIESIYGSFLRIVQKNWTTPRTISVLGKEKAFESIDIKGADLANGYAFVAEYGASLSLDPTTRREEIITLMPLFEKAGVEPRQVMQMLKLNELSGMYDTLELAKDRQQEIFNEMIARGIYIQPEELQDHANMLKYAYYYLMTTEFKYLTDDEKALIRRHVREREILAALGVQGAPALGSGNPPGPTPQNPAGTAPALPGIMGPVTT